MNSWSWYISHFPESMFLSSQANIDQYISNIIRGKDIASNSNILICGITRNADRILPYTIARIETLGALFKDYHVCLFENDSTDGTLNVLNKWASSNSKVTVLSDKFNPPPFTDIRGIDRRRYMAMARNQYLQFAREYATTNKIDYIIIVDTDLLGGWSYHGVLNTLGQETAWDIIGSNSLCYRQNNNEWQKLFYDSWAFRPLEHPTALEDVDANLFVFYRGEDLIRVNSCFGGLGVYRTHFLFENLNYTEDDCDHPTLHNELVKRGYQIYLNPSQITLYNKSQYVI